MSEISKYEEQKKKMDGLCEEHDLVYRFRKDTYPITLTIRPIQGVGEQLSLLAKTEDEDYISPDAVMKWIFADGELTSRVEGGIFTISKTLRTKIENIFLKMIGFWQQYFFRDVIEKGSLRKGTMPVIDEAEAEDDEDEDLEDQPDEDAGLDDDSDGQAEDEDDPDDDGADPDEDQITAATQLVRFENKASISLLQRRLNLGYSKAARLMDVLEDRGIVGPYVGSQPREVLPYDAPADEEGSDNE